MHRFATRRVGELRQGKGNEEADDGVDGEGEAAPLDAPRVERGLRIGGAEDVTRNRASSAL